MLQVYRETFRASTQARGFFKRQSGGKGQFGDVWIEFTPNEEGKGFEFENAIVSGVVPVNLSQRLKRFGMANGVLAGYPMVDVKLTMVHVPRYRLIWTAQDRGFTALKEAAVSTASHPEPMMLVTNTVPEERNPVMLWVTYVRRRVGGMKHGNSQIVRAYSACWNVLATQQFFVLHLKDVVHSWWYLTTTMYLSQYKKKSLRKQSGD